MRLTSQQIYDEILLQDTINNLEDKEDFIKCINDLKNFTSRELTAYRKLDQYARLYPTLEKYIEKIKADKWNEIINHLEITEGQAEEFLEDIERIEK